MDGNPFGHVLAGLTERQSVVDLGCGSGSFHYEVYNCRIIAMDLNVPQRAGCSHASFVQSHSAAIPLKGSSIDVVVCHHTLEHFDDFRATLIEINRILRDDGLIWIAIPNGYGLDDELYRFVFSGGGHVNRFSRDQLIEEVHHLTRFRLAQTVDLFSSFIYLKKPTEQEYQHYPRTARFLFHIPDGASGTGIIAVNAVTRLMDKLFGCRSSQYGWGFLFAPEGASLPPLGGPYFNVCSKCGSGIPARQLRENGMLKQWCGVGFFHCPNCRQLNAFVSPPAGCE
ncbi:MAG TPA: class I SAM-dependent methyltransferase [Terriglobia bacterium]|jgi:ubiquinone/menaquinone biosynthesis C-methylase UbiE